MLVGFTYQEALLRQRYSEFNSRVESAVEVALLEKEKRVRRLEDEAAAAQREWVHMRDAVGAHHYLYHNAMRGDRKKHEYNYV
jgi:hypothetical protein